MMEVASRATALMSPSKILARHLDRQAIVYIRQSTLQQIEQHRESTSLQYGLVDHACRLGWARPHVTVIDDDLGCSGASTEGRQGFQRLVSGGAFQGCRGHLTNKVPIFDGKPTKLPKTVLCRDVSHAGDLGIGLL